MTATILNPSQDYSATLRPHIHIFEAPMSRPLSQTMSTPIRLYDSGLLRGRMVQHPIGFTAADIFQVRSEDFGHRRTHAFPNVSHVCLFQLFYTFVIIFGMIRMRYGVSIRLIFTNIMIRIKFI